MKVMTTGSYNTSMGYQSLDAATTAASNTAFGYTALTANTTGTENVAVGATAGETLTEASYSVAIGSNALGDGAVTGVGNVAVGRWAMQDQTSGTYNVAIGYVAMKANTTGSDNIGIGANTLDANTTGANNTAVGDAALTASDSNNNTAVGWAAGSGVTTGANNLFLGKDAGITGSPGGAITTASNEIGLGDENISAANIQVDWTIASDKRDKTDVEPMDLGLEFINQLEPVTYRWDKRSKYSEDQSVNPDGTHKEEQLEGGFLAQDVEAIEEQYGHKLSDNTNLTFHLSEDEKMYGIKYGKFVPMLVKAVQELSAEVEALKKEKNNGSN
jgi:hypothetical protein